MRILSGGQTGVDRAALDVALEMGLELGGWCPRGRLAEDGPLSAEYPLRETPSARYAQRTEWNVRDADATLILAAGRLRGGTKLTARLAGELAKPWKVVDPNSSDDVVSTLAWFEANRVGVLNVAGPRESGAPGIYQQAVLFLRRLLSTGSESGRL